MKTEDFFWLVGFLEGEGSFCKGPPSSPASPQISFSTTDEDVAQRVALLRIDAERRGVSFWY